MQQSFATYSVQLEMRACCWWWLFFAISHLAIIMKSDHHQQQRLISQLYTMGCKGMLFSKPCYAKCEFFLELYNIYYIWGCLLKPAIQFALSAHLIMKMMSFITPPHLLLSLATISCEGLIFVYLETWLLYLLSYTIQTKNQPNHLSYASDWLSNVSWLAILAS